MENLKGAIWKNRTSLLLLLLLLLLLFLIIYNSLFSADSFENRDNVNPNEKKSYNIESSSLYPNGYNRPTISPATQVLGVSVQKPTSTAKYQKLKSTPKPKILPETVSSTVQGRDSDRQLITELLSDLITEYMFYYELAPDIYIDKSGSLLKDDSHADQIFLYNGTRNRTNALSIKLIPKTYFFNLVSSCKGNESKIANLNFVFDRENNKLTLCKEDLTTIDYVIGH